MTIAGQRQSAGALCKISAASSVNQCLPVFRGLDDVTIAGKEIAAIAGVTPPTFSRWRAGRASVPERKLVFLTLLLAHWIDELEALLGNRDSHGKSKIKTRLNTTRRCLFQQEVINQTLPPETVREGSHLFRKWWFEEGARATKMSGNETRIESLYE